MRFFISFCFFFVSVVAYAESADFEFRTDSGRMLSVVVNGLLSRNIDFTYSYKEGQGVLAVKKSDRSGLIAILKESDGSDSAPEVRDNKNEANFEKDYTMIGFLCLLLEKNIVFDVVPSRDGGVIQYELSLDGTNELFEQFSENMNSGGRVSVCSE